MLIEEENMNKIEKCDICGEEVVFDKWGNGRCKKCRWYPTDNSRKQPNDVLYPNITSLNHAKELFKEGKSLKPTFEEFLLIIEGNLEPTFWYKNKKYLTSKFDTYGIAEENNYESFQDYKTLKEFGDNVRLNGELLKDVWNKVYRFQLGC